MSEAEMEDRFRRFTALCTEDYLIRYANKGLYNRALKDLEKGVSVRYAFGGGEVRCLLSDGTECVLTDSIERFDCSCPADKICKHVLIAILGYGGAGTGEAVEAAGQAETAGEERAGEAVDLEDSASPAAALREAGDAAASALPEQGAAAGAEAEAKPRKAGSDKDRGLDKAAARGEDAGANGRPDEPGVETGNRPAADGKRTRSDLPAASFSSSASEAPQLDFGWLLERSLGELIAPFADARAEEAAFRLRYREELEVSTGSLLVVRMVRSGIEVAFTAAPDVGKALCAVPGAEGEMYKLEALLRYRAQRGLRDEDALAGKLTPVRASSDTLDEFRGAVSALLHTGLARLPRSIADRFELLAVSARSAGLPNLEREARGIRGELELFFARHVRFSAQALTGRLTRLYLMLESLERDPGPARRAQLAGRFRSKYYTVPRLDLYALGAEPWETRSAYRGITYYFYCAEDGGVYTYTQARPAYYEGADFSFARHYRQGSPWRADLTMQRASVSLLSLRSVKVSADGRLSSSAPASLALPERPPVEAADFGELLAPDFASLPAGPAERKLFGARPRRLRLIRASSIEGCAYDDAAQALKLTAADTNGERLELLLPYHADWQTAIRRLEEGRGRPDAGEFYIFAAVDEDGVYPISFLQGAGQLNLKLDL
ncbi:hypothetical protein QWJ34_16770 [Saccharibacillus sp. CPCC 101409]|uniref:hypothetical protein n=1 Tax=Saccharibacillus sp. CPCC 101409 TaxID=3058041 RepID=UPI0026713A13|nr:hypothetical protein [Saccharibacillus sp. CPCC 101409]MDO3411421.1 hypothetical protein [Saccharibacillus sp. CPCC 101409]